MSANENLETLLRRGIQAARTGDRATARQLLEAVIARDDSHELAWIWLASVVPTDRERRICLERVLQLNPNNARAREALNALVGIGRDKVALSGDVLEHSASQRLSGNGQGGTLLANPLVRIGLVLAGVAGLLLISTVFFRTPEPPPQPTSRPQPAVVIVNTPTITPSPTFPGVLVTRSQSDQALPPTFTPTPTDTPSATPSPTETPFPLSEFALFYTARNTGQPQPGLYRIQGDGTGEQGLVENADDISFDAGGSTIVFAREVAYEANDETGEAASTVSEIFIAPANNPASARQLTSIRTHSAYQPTISPDGRQVVFVSDFDGDEELWLIDTQTGVITQLTQNEATDRNPHWSPHGTTLIFASDRDSPDYMEIYTMNMVDPNGEFPVTQLTDDTGSSYEPRWSPDGTYIAYTNTESVHGSIYLMKADGSRRTRLTRDTDVNDSNPDWTPDGRYVAFLSNREDERYQVYLVDLRGREILRVTQAEREITAMGFQPDIRFRLN